MPGENSAPPQLVVECQVSVLHGRHTHPVNNRVSDVHDQDEHLAHVESDEHAAITDKTVVHVDELGGQVGDPGDKETRGQDHPRYHPARRLPGTDRILGREHPDWSEVEQDPRVDKSGDDDRGGQ